VSGLVRLVGVGPGHPGMITVQAVEAIRGADAVRHQLVEPALLSLARPGADVRLFVSNEDVLELARQGRQVVVLYPGDPYMGAAAVELGLKLARSGVPFESVPGLVAETAGPTVSGVPLTVEGRSASIQIGLRREGETTVLRLAAGWWESGVRALLAAGFAPEARAAFLVNPGSAGQYRLAGSLRELTEMAGHSSHQGEAVLVIGPGVELADQLDTLSRRPLHGRRILVTRAQHQVEPFRAQLIELGAEVVHVPTIEVRPMGAGDATRRAFGLLPKTSLVVFTSTNAVEIIFQMLFDAGLDARGLQPCRVCAIGSETARSLADRGIQADLVAGEYSAEGLADALQGWDLEGARVLVPRAKVARDALPALLAQRGARVEILPVYETVCPPAAAEALRGLFAGRGVDVATFTSSSTVTNFVQAFPAGEAAAVLNGARVACMGPVTADTARKLGLRVDIIAREYTTRGLALAIAEATG